MAVRFLVGLIITSRTRSLAELATLLGQEPQSGSHDKGDPRGLSGSGSVWSDTVWRQDASDSSATWREQCSDLLRQIPAKATELLDISSDDSSIYLDIAVFSSDAYASIVVPHALIAELSAARVKLEVTVYPVQEEDDNYADEPGHDDALPPSGKR